MKKRYIGAGIGTIIVLVVLVAAIRLIPLVQAALLLHGMSEFDGIQYEISMDLEEENLSDQQKQLVGALAWILDGGEASGLSWKIDGRVSAGQAYGKVYCEGRREPVTELYLRQGEGLINVEMLYDSVRENVLSWNPLLGSALPEWEYGSFLSSAQIEEAFQVDLRELFQIEELTESQARSSWESFRILLGMKRKKGADGERQFETELGDYQVVLEIAEEGDFPVISVTASDRTESKEVAAYAGKFAFLETEEVAFPDSLMENEDIQQFAKLWSVINNLKNMFP